MRDFRASHLVSPEKKKGFDDKEKGNLFFAIMNIIDVKKPKTLFLENVKNLHVIHKGKTFETIISEIRKRGYHISYKVIDSKYYNSPQSRQRIYIICDKEKTYTFREVENKMVPVSSILDESCHSEFKYHDTYELKECKNKKGMMKYKLINKKTGKGGRQGERVYKIDRCGPTICASSGGPGAKTGLYDINGKIRTLNVTEVLRMFGFHHYTYSCLKNKNKMLFYLGNSIVVNVLSELTKDLEDIL